MLVFVDDPIFISSCHDNLETDVHKLLEKFEGIQEVLSWYLDVHIQLRDQFLQFLQSEYIDQWVSAFGLNYNRVFSTPMAPIFFKELEAHKED